uniref:Uncharacterized protein n=1 Tax=Romanomermis culicivorax TaxID=13658 RepID=A0A915KT12_ROMCU
MDGEKYYFMMMERAYNMRRTETLLVIKNGFQCLFLHEWRREHVINHYYHFLSLVENIHGLTHIGSMRVDTHLSDKQCLPFTGNFVCIACRLMTKTE